MKKFIELSSKDQLYLISKEKEKITYHICALTNRDITVKKCYRNIKNDIYLKLDLNKYIKYLDIIKSNIEKLDFSDDEKNDFNKLYNETYDKIKGKPTELYQILVKLDCEETKNEDN